MQPRLQATDDVADHVVHERREHERGTALHGQSLKPQSLLMLSMKCGARHMQLDVALDNAMQRRRKNGRLAYDPKEKSKHQAFGKANKQKCLTSGATSNLEAPYIRPSGPSTNDLPDATLTCGKVSFAAVREQSRDAPSNHVVSAISQSFSKMNRSWSGSDVQRKLAMLGSSLRHFGTTIHPTPTNDPAKWHA